MKKTMKYAAAIFTLAAMLVAVPAQARKQKPSTNINNEQSEASRKPTKPIKEPRMSADVKKIYDLARQGNAKAQNALGICYLNGKGVAKNDSLAYLWFSQAAKQKYPNALVNVATCVRRGIAVKKDSIMARDLYLNAIGNAIQQKNDTILQTIDKAAQTDIFLARTLAYGYYNGKGGLKRNPAAAKQYLKIASDNGDVSAYYPYAMLSLRTGDHPSAQRYFGKAMENDVKNASYWYGRYLINGEGGSPDPTRGYNLVLPYARKGMSGAQVLIADCLLTGNGVATNEKEAVGYLEKAAAKGNPEAIWQLALCNAGGKGTETDFNKAFKLMCREAMHSSENRFKNWIDPKTDNLKMYAPYVLFLQGMKALNDSNGNIAVALTISKTLVKQKYTKDGKILEGLYWLNLNNPKRNVKKGLKALKPYLNDEQVAYTIAAMQLAEKLEGENQMKEGYTAMQKLADNGFGPAISVIGDLYALGSCGLTASNQRAINYWLKAYNVDGLSVPSAHALAAMFEEGLGGLKKDVEKAKKLRSTYRADFTDVMLDLVPDYEK